MNLRPGVHELDNGQVVRVKFVSGKRDLMAQLLICNYWLPADELLDRVKPWTRLDAVGAAAHVRRTGRCPWCRSVARPARNPLRGLDLSCARKLLG